MSVLADGPKPRQPARTRAATGFDSGKAARRRPLELGSIPRRFTKDAIKSQKRGWLIWRVVRGMMGVIVV